MKNTIHRVRVLLLVSALLGDSLSAPGWSERSLLRSPECRPVSRIQDQAISPPLSVSTHGIVPHLSLPQWLSRAQDGHREEGIHLEHSLNRFLSQEARAVLSAELISHGKFHQIPNLLNWNGKEFNEVHQGETVRCFVEELPTKTAVVLIDLAETVTGNRRKLVDRAALRRLLGSSPGQDLGQRWYVIRDMATGQEYSRYPGWWILRHGLELSVPPPGVQGLLIEPLPEAEKPLWWKNAFSVLFVEGLPLFSPRREPSSDPGIGKFLDWGSHYRSAKENWGVDVQLMLPHYAVLEESPYAPVSVMAVNEDGIDWSVIPDVTEDAGLEKKLNAPLSQQHEVRYSIVRAWEREVGIQASRTFLRHGDAHRRAEFERFTREHDAWLRDYASFMAIHEIINRPALSWSEQEIRAAVQSDAFETLFHFHRYAQWLAYGQLSQGISDIHAQGGKVLFDVPMFRGKDSVDVWKHREYFIEPENRYPGIRIENFRDGETKVDANEHWQDLAVWNWPYAAAKGFEFQLASMRHWLTFFDGARLDALHFSYEVKGAFNQFNQPADQYVGAVVRLFHAQGKFIVAEAFDNTVMNGKERAIKDLVTAHGVTTVGFGDDDYHRLSDHDDNIWAWRNRKAGLDFLEQMIFRVRRSAWWHPAAQFASFIVGHLWRDPNLIKVETRDAANQVIQSDWTYRVPHPEDPDYYHRILMDTRRNMQGLAAYRDGWIWNAPRSLARRLAIAADEFVHETGGFTQIFAAADSHGQSFRRVYDRDPWFQEEWGRDAFISLPGLLLATGRFEQAKSVIEHFAGHIRNGVIPNRIWNEENIEYNNADGSLWFIQAVQATVKATGDEAFQQRMLPVMKQVVEYYRKPKEAAEPGAAYYFRDGAYHRIYMDSDGLIVSPAQATWMDADPQHQGAITPRNGKAVEINALWYDTLCYLAEAERHETTASSDYRALASRVRDSFNAKFWNEKEQALYDVIEGDPHGAALRPNMLFAISRGGDLLSFERQKKVWAAAAKDLLTPYGLRTLSPRDSNYRGSYDTRQPDVVKDYSYHQGTVWPWLIGPYVDSLWKVRVQEGVSEEAVRGEIRELLTPLMEDLETTVYGSIYELRRGDWPHRPEGPPAQAWSVAEMIRVATRYGVIAPALVVTENSLNMVPQKITVDPVVPYRDGSYEVTARAYGRNGFSPAKLVIQISTHKNMLDHWGQFWTGLEGIPMRLTSRDGDGAYVYVARFHPGPGKHEGIVRAAAPERLGEWRYAEGGNMHFEHARAAVGADAYSVPADVRARLEAIKNSVYALAPPVPAEDITSPFLAAEDAPLEEVRQLLLTRESSLFRAGLQSFSHQAPMAGLHTPRGWLIRRSPTETVPAADASQPVRWRIGTAGRQSRSLSIHVDDENSMDIKGSGDGDSIFPLGLDMSQSGFSSTWLRYGELTSLAYRELLNGLRLQEVALSATGLPLAMCTPLQVVKLLKLRHGTELVSVRDYFMRYLMREGDVDEAGVHVLRKMLMSSVKSAEPLVDSMPLAELVDLFLQYKSPVQLHSTMPQTDIRAVHVSHLNAAELPTQYRELYAAFGWRYRDVAAPQNMKRSDASHYLRLIHQANEDTIMAILFQAALQLGEVAGTAIGVGADISGALGISNLMGFAWAKDFEGSNVPARNQKDFSPALAAKGLHQALSNGEEALKSLAEFLTGADANAEEALATFKHIVFETFQTVQTEIMDKLGQQVFHPEYVAAFQTWRNESPAIRSLAKNKSPLKSA